MIGDPADIKARLLSVMPARWFGLQGVSVADGTAAANAPVLDSLLSGLSSGLSLIYALFDQVRQQARIATATGEFLDMAAYDYFGAGLTRRSQEPDNDYRSRILSNLLLPRGTRSDVSNALYILTNRVPTIFEPARVTDTGAYGSSNNQTFGLAYGVVGGWGSLDMPFQFFVTAYRPLGEGIASIGGYGTAGARAYGNLSMITGTVKDSDIFACVAGVIPAATIGWVSIAG